MAVECSECENCISVLVGVDDRIDEIYTEGVCALDGTVVEEETIPFCTGFEQRKE